MGPTAQTVTAGRLLSGLLGLLAVMAAQALLLAVPVWLLGNRGLQGFGVQLGYLQTFWLVLAAQSLLLPLFILLLAMWSGLRKTKESG